MDKGDQSFSDMKELADSLRRKFDHSYPLCEECCIYRVPEPRRCLHPSDYAPKMVSIGPLHHGKEGLKALEENKIRYLQKFLQRTQVSIEYLLSLIKDTEGKLRSCYAEPIELESDYFVRMILVDSVFLIELFLRCYDPNLITNDDRIFRKPNKIDLICSDLQLVENQIPLFILTDLFDRAKTAPLGGYYERLSLMKIIISTWGNVLIFLPWPMDPILLEINFLEAKHILDLLRLCLQPSPLRTRINLHPQAIPSAMELHQAGIKFKLGSNNPSLDITFNKGILEIPFLTVYDNTECFYRNLLAFENMHDTSRYFNDYIVMMSYLVNTAKDAELLIQNGVIGLGNSKRLSTVFHNLIKESTLNYGNFQYSGLVEDLQRYCRYPCHKWKAILKQNYFNTPWAFISFMAALILLVLTFIQTLCSISTVGKA